MQVKKSKRVSTDPMKGYGRYISIDPDIAWGKPCIAGTRISVEFILERLSCGATIDYLLEQYPRLTRKKILAALAFASARVRYDFDRGLIAGTAISVDLVLEQFAEGGTVDSVLAQHPNLTQEQVCAALAFASAHIYERYHRLSRKLLTFRIEKYLFDVFQLP